MFLSTSYVVEYQTFTLEKNWRSQNLSGKKIFRKENLKKCTSFEQKGTRYIRGNVYFGIIVVSCLSSTKPYLRFFLVCFTREIKCSYQSSLGNEIDSRGIMNASPNILAKNQNFENVRHGFIDERAMITTTLISSCHYKTLAPFFLQNKRPENTFLTLTVNYHKIV